MPVRDEAQGARSAGTAAYIGTYVEVASTAQRSDSPVQTLNRRFLGGSSSVGRASAFQAECRGFEPRLPLQSAHVAQSAERVLGKDEVTSSNLVVGSRAGIDKNAGSSPDRLWDGRIKIRNNSNREMQ